jgi:hypothetical protein
MKRAKVSKIADIESFEHLDFIIKHTTPQQRFRWLEQAWKFWYYLRKNVLSKRVGELQDKFRQEKI